MLEASEYVMVYDATLVTDSLRVAMHFGKKHGNVLRAYDELACSETYRALNFELTMQGIPGPNGATRKERLVRMTKDGFMFMVMGFTGKEAACIKERYICEFNKMANQLEQIGSSLWVRRLALEARNANSFEWASFGSKRMLERRRELPKIRTEREQLDFEMQPPLFGQISQPQELAP